MQLTCLLGDTDIFELYKELTSKEFSYKKILAETEILSNLYYHQIRDGAQAIRIPTRYCTANHPIFKNFYKIDGTGIASFYRLVVRNVSKKSKNNLYFLWQRK